MVKIPSPERLYQTVDGRVVREGHPDAARLYAAKGRKVPVSILDGLDDQPEAVSLDTGETVRFGGQPEPETPAEPEPAVEAEEETGLTCPVCGYEAGNAGGLASHRRSHEEEPQ